MKLWINMKKILSLKLSIQLSIIIFGIIILFHLSIIIGYVFFDFAPVDFLWGGRIETKEKFLAFEIISLIITALCLFIVLVKSGRIYLPWASGIITVALWILFLMFLGNTIGNIFAKTVFEKLFAIVTAILSILCLRLAVEKK